MIKILFIGDIVSKVGRNTIKKVLPMLKKRDSIDLCLANGENLAGGRGLTKETVEEVIGYGVDYLTGGDHTFWQRSFKDEINDLPVLRPINLTEDKEGYGSCEIEVGSKAKVSVVSLLGTGSTFIRTAATNPFSAMEEFLSKTRRGRNRTILVDFHAESTSEKVAMGWFLDGKVSAVLGTHTHIPTSDGWIMPNDTAYVTDVGMVGPRISVLGVKKEIIINRFYKGDTSSFEWVKSGSAVFNSVLITINEKTGKAVSIERRDEYLDVK